MCICTYGNEWVGEWVCISYIQTLYKHANHHAPRLHERHARAHASPIRIGRIRHEPGRIGATGDRRSRRRLLLLLLGLGLGRRGRDDRRGRVRAGRGGEGQRVVGIVGVGDRLGDREGRRGGGVSVGGGGGGLGGAEGERPGQEFLFGEALFMRVRGVRCGCKCVGVSIYLSPVTVHTIIQQTE